MSISFQTKDISVIPEEELWLLTRTGFVTQDRTSHLFLPGFPLVIRWSEAGGLGVVARMHGWVPPSQEADTIRSEKASVVTIFFVSVSASEAGLVQTQACLHHLS